jgi:Fe-S cluster assembly scaffold protein SufB
MDSSAFFGIATVAFLQSTTMEAFVPPRSFAQTARPQQARQRQPTPLGMAIGIGPKEVEVTNTTERIILGEDGEPLPYITDSEPYRLDRLSKFDAAADDWYASILESDSPSFLGQVSELAREKIVTPVELVDEPTFEYGHEEWTPYVNRRLPTSPLYPAYGLERFGLPVCRKGAEAWRHFDVGGLVEVDYSGIVEGIGTDMELSEQEAADISSALQKKGAWLDDDACAGRLVYVNGRFCPSLSKQTNLIKNLDSTYFNGTNQLSEETLKYLNRLPDGFTDELAAEVPDEEKGMLKSLKKLSGPDHSVGEPTSQFAINNQQGTAAFAALNSVKAGCVAYVEVEKGDVVTKPILVVNALSPSGGKVGNDEKGVSIHPRLLGIAHDESSLSLIQSNVDLKEDSEESPCATFVNGYTQIFAGSKANFTHCYLEETGGTVTPRVEMTSAELDAAKLAFKPGQGPGALDVFIDNPREVEAKRPAIRNTHFQAIDAHVTGDEGSFTSTLMNIGGSGRCRLAISATLLRPGAAATINGFSLSGGAQRTDMRTNIHHIAQGTISRQDQRHMVGGRSTATFRGRVRVEQSAQQTDAEQLSRTILLSDHARIWAIPSMEIIADDVKCGHGATVSDLSEEELFYLRSRGIDLLNSRNILMYAFAEEVGSTVDRAIAGEFNDENGLRSRIIKKLRTIAPEGEKVLVGGEFQSV